MITASLGGLIKEFRIKKRLSQQDVSLLVGWKDTTRLSKIEQSRVGSISHDILHKIIKALDLNENERARMLLASGIVPTKEESKQLINKLKESLSYINAPLYVVDFAWNTIYINDLTKKLFMISDNEHEYINSKMPNWMELVFLRKTFSKVAIREGYNKAALYPYNEFQVAYFKDELAPYAQDRWYKDLLLQLSQDEYFRKLWSNIPALKNVALYEYWYKEISGKWKDKPQVLKLHSLSIRPSFDFRYFITSLHAVDENTFKFYAK